jgi:hypothetical protein
MASVWRWRPLAVAAADAAGGPRRAVPAAGDRAQRCGRGGSLATPLAVGRPFANLDPSAEVVEVEPNLTAGQLYARQFTTASELCDLPGAQPEQLACLVSRQKCCHSCIFHGNRRASRTEATLCAEKCGRVQESASQATVTRAWRGIPPACRQRATGTSARRSHVGTCQVPTWLLGFDGTQTRRPVPFSLGAL